jgi:tRNA pseudouridine55 synthase
MTPIAPDPPINPSARCDNERAIVIDAAHNPSGVLVIDKPAGITSFEVVKAVRRALRIKKAGHTGTLDPLATGVLPVCLGEATKIAGLLLAEDKSYQATMRFGLETDTLDSTGRVLAEHDPSAVNQSALESLLPTFLGSQQQTPPAFSAIRCQGQRAYQRARRGETVELAPREVRIDRLELLRWDPPDLVFLVDCSKGTFIRSFAADLGRKLGCGAVLSGLRRLRSGPFDLEQAVPLDRVAACAETGELRLLSMDQALGHLPGVDLSAPQVGQVRQGQPIIVGDPALGAGLIRLRWREELIALGEQRDEKIWPKRVFVSAPA